MKLSDRYISGLPDFLAIKDGQAYAIECKSERGEARPLQKYILAQMELAGAQTCVAKSISDVAKLF